MPVDLRDIEPKPISAKQLAGKFGWPEAKAIFILEAFVRQGLATKDADDKYTISGMGLTAGERLGVVKPITEWPGFSAS